MASRSNGSKWGPELLPVPAARRPARGAGMLPASKHSHFNLPLRKTATGGSGTIRPESPSGGLLPTKSGVGRSFTAGARRVSEFGQGRFQRPFDWERDGPRLPSKEARLKRAKKTTARAHTGRQRPAYIPATPAKTRERACKTRPRARHEQPGFQGRTGPRRSIRHPRRA
jgi:hypothetical protein